MGGGEKGGECESVGGQQLVVEIAASAMAASLRWRLNCFKFSVFSTRLDVATMATTATTTTTKAAAVGAFSLDWKDKCQPRPARLPSSYAGILGSPTWQIHTHTHMDGLR